MGHLEDVEMTYFQHMRFALRNCARMASATTMLFIHAFIPSWFVDSGSSIINKVHFDLMSNKKYKSRILVRFNTKWKEDDLGRYWRVMENGVETLAREVLITIPCTTIQEDVPENGTKWHFLCYGSVTWDNDHNAKIA